MLRVLIAFGLLFGALPALAGNSIAGAAIYADHCAICHGPSGSSIHAGVPNFSRGEAIQRMDSVLLGSVRMGKGTMPAFRGILTDSEILDAIAYIRTLQ